MERLGCIGLDHQHRKLLWEREELQKWWRNRGLLPKQPTHNALYINAILAWGVFWPDTNKAILTWVACFQHCQFHSPNVSLFSTVILSQWNRFILSNKLVLFSFRNYWSISVTLVRLSKLGCKSRELVSGEWNKQTFVVLHGRRFLKKDIQNLSNSMQNHSRRNLCRGRYPPLLQGAAIRIWTWAVLY